MSKEFFYRNLKRQYPTISSGTGVWLTDSQAKQYLDGCSGAVVANIGHGVSEVNEAINDQLRRVAFAHSSQFVSEAALNLAEKLIKMAPSGFNPGGRTYFVSGGSEAVETALKMARAYFYEMGATQKHIVISRRNSYHGSTQGALSATGHPARRKPYLPLLAGNPQVSPSYPYRCACGAAGVCSSAVCGKRLADELEAAIVQAGPENVMAFIAEPVVGAALGAVPPHPDYFKHVREVCNRHSVLLIADEVMTGLGRIGADFGLSLFGVEADIIALGKGLSAGYMPLGAVLASKRVVSAFENGTGIFEHGFTYSAHPTACAAGLAVLEYMEANQLTKRVGELELRLKDGLSAVAAGSAIVGDVRGKGFLWGMEFVCDREAKSPFPSELKLSQNLAAEAASQGLLIYPGSGSIDGASGDHVIVAPPYTASEAELDKLFELLSVSVKNIAQAIGKVSNVQ